MLGGVQFETGGVGPVPYLNILGGTSQKKHPVYGAGYTWLYMVSYLCFLCFCVIIAYSFLSQMVMKFENFLGLLLE